MSDSYLEEMNEALRQIWVEGDGVMRFIVIGPESVLAVLFSSDPIWLTAMGAISSALKDIASRPRKNAVTCLLCDSGKFWRRSSLPMAFSIVSAQIDRPTRVITSALCTECYERHGDGLMDACAAKWQGMCKAGDFRRLPPLSPAGHA